MDPFLSQFSILVGEWKGEGRGCYPTIESFEFSETLRFVSAPTYPMLFYEQRTWLSSGEASHWETGFWRPGPERDTIEISNAQDSGRVEVLRGRCSETEEGRQIVLASVLHGNDVRVVETRRTFLVVSDLMTYSVEMSTRTTHEPRLQRHLEATLRRTGFNTTDSRLAGQHL